MATEEKNTRGALILVVDDDDDMRALLERLLIRGGFEVSCADGAKQADVLLNLQTPDLILLDAMMPGVSGYEYCINLQTDEKRSSIPVIFMTALQADHDRVWAFSVGAVDYLTKPPRASALKAAINRQLERKTNKFKKRSLKALNALKEGSGPPDLSAFKNYLSQKSDLSSKNSNLLLKAPYTKLYEVGDQIGIPPGQMARLIAEFLKMPYNGAIDAEQIELGVLPTAFCKRNFVIPVNSEGSAQSFILSNPFNFEIIDTIQQSCLGTEAAILSITEPENISLIIKYADSMFCEEDDLQSVSGENESAKSHPVVQIAETVLSKALAERASDIHIQPAENETMIRFRVDGDLKKIMALKKKIGTMLISRFKAIGKLDIAEKRKPQDGAMETEVNGRRLKLRLSTTETPHGESLVIRVLLPDVKPKPLSELGMTPAQAKRLQALASRSQGLILLVGTTGSGKTTTIFSLLSHVDCSTRNLMSVEDPVEYRIPDANQHQVNEKAGVTFQALLKSSVRQDPDILFIGEIRDERSARTAVDFSSTGHLTISTLHTANTTSAVFRLQRLGVERSLVADSVIGVVAQKLIKCLCLSCKALEPPTAEERELLAPFMRELPEFVGRAVGCVKCNKTGYFGRVGIYELLEFSPKIVEMIRSGMPISELRQYVRDSGGFLISDHAIEKMKNGLLTPADIFEKVLCEESPLTTKTDDAAEIAAEIDEDRVLVLVVEDDPDTAQLIIRPLEAEGYDVSVASDGVEALMAMGRRVFDLILADINMPNLDGFKLMEMKNLKDIQSQVIFMTGDNSRETEEKALAMGAADFISKPFYKKIFMPRVRRVVDAAVVRRKAKL